MKSYGLDFRGPILIERVATLPDHDPTDKGRLVFNEDDNTVYLIAHWFPRMAVYSDSDGWQNQQFHHH